MVQTVSERWVGNVFNAISKGIFDINFWTNGCTPTKKHNPERLEVYYQKSLILAGDLIKWYKEESLTIYCHFLDQPEAIGLQPGDNFADFDDMLNSAFSSPQKEKIGNLIFKVDTISKNMANNFEKKGVNFSSDISKVNTSLINQRFYGNIKYDIRN